MKTRIALGTGLLLTLGTAVAGSFIYSRDRADETLTPQSTVAEAEITPEMIIMWKATVSSTDYISPKVPI